jgi:hypothetical protein
VARSEPTPTTRQGYATLPTAELLETPLRHETADSAAEELGGVDSGQVAYDVVGGEIVRPKANGQSKHSADS